MHEEIQLIMRRIERMRLAYPHDYKHRVGYLTDVDKLVVACRKLVLSLPPLSESIDSMADLRRKA